MANENNPRARVRAVFDAYKKESDSAFRVNLPNISRNLQHNLDKKVNSLWRGFLLKRGVSREKIDGWAEKEGICTSKACELFYKVGELMDDAAFGNLLAQKSVARYDKKHGFGFRDLADRLHVNTCIGLETGRPVHLMAKDLMFFNGLYGFQAVSHEINFEKLGRVFVPVAAEYYFFGSIIDGICRAVLIHGVNESVKDDYGSSGPKHNFKGDVGDWGKNTFDPKDSGDYDFLQPS